MPRLIRRLGYLILFSLFACDGDTQQEHPESTKFDAGSFSSGQSVDVLVRGDLQPSKDTTMSDSSPVSDSTVDGGISLVTDADSPHPFSPTDVRPPSADTEPANTMSVMEIIKKIKAVPRKVIFVSLYGKIMVTTKTVALPAGLTPPRDSAMAATCRRDDVGIYEWNGKGWRYAKPFNGGMFEPMTVLTQAEIERLGIDKDVVERYIYPNGNVVYPNPESLRFLALSIDEWISSQSDLDAALKSLSSEVPCY